MAHRALLQKTLAKTIDLKSMAKTVLQKKSTKKPKTGKIPKNC
jgi:hypothetical protein